MLRAAFVALSIEALALSFWGPTSQAGWSDAATNLSGGASSVVVSVKKHKNDDGDEDGDHNKGKKKKTSDGEGLSECTIQSPNGGGGCKGGFKRVCEKLKSGKKCCGCVVDPNAKPQDKPAGTQAQTVAHPVCCVGHFPGDNISDKVCKDTEVEARAIQQTATFNGDHPTSIECFPR